MYCPICGKDLKCVYDVTNADWRRASYYCVCGCRVLFSGVFKGYKKVCYCEKCGKEINWDKHATAYYNIEKKYCPDCWNKIRSDE